MNYIPQPYQPMGTYMPQQIYQPQMQTTPQVPQYAAQGVPWVNSIEEVRSCVTPFGQKTMFMNRYEPIFYIRDVDRNGTAFVYEYDFSEHKTEPVEQPQPVEYVTRDEMMAEFNKMKEQYESLVQSANAAEQPYEPESYANVESFAPRHAATGAAIQQCGIVPDELS